MVVVVSGDSGNCVTTVVLAEVGTVVMVTGEDHDDGDRDDNINGNGDSGVFSNIHYQCKEKGGGNTWRGLGLKLFPLQSSLTEPRTCSVPCLAGRVAWEMEEEVNWSHLSTQCFWMCACFCHCRQVPSL